MISPVYEYYAGTIEHPRKIVEKLLEGLDILFIDPALFPSITPTIKYLKSVFPDYQRQKKLDFFLSYIADQPKREEYKATLLHIRPEPKTKPPAFSPDQLEKEVKYILKTEDIKEYSEAELELIACELRCVKKAEIARTNYFEAERIEHLLRKLLNHGQLTEVEKIQEKRVDFLRMKVIAAENELLETKLKWESTKKSIREKADLDFQMLKDECNKALAELEKLYESDPPYLTKYSNDVSNLRKKGDLLVKTKNFFEAELIYAEVRSKEKSEKEMNREKWKSNIDLKRKRVEENFQKTLDARKQFWAKEEKLIISNANAEIVKAEKAINHLKANLDEIEHRKKIVGKLKINPKTFTDNVPTPTEYRQRAILNQKIYTRMMRKPQFSGLKRKSFSAKQQSRATQNFRSLSVKHLP